MNGFSTSQLALLVYQAAQDREQWPRLVSALRDTANPFDDDELYGNPGARRQVLDELLPHIRQALTLEAELQRNASARELLSSTLEVLPLGIAVVDRDLNILTINRLANAALSGSSVLARHGGRFKINNREKHHALHGLIDDCLSTGASHAIALPDNQGQSISLMLCPSEITDAVENQPAINLFITNPAMKHLVDDNLLAELYRLTAAEASLTRELIGGLSLEEIAGQRGVSEQTVRSQLKSVFRKTDTGRQAELVSLILSGLVPLGAPAPRPRASRPPRTSTAPVRHLRTNDQRCLAFCEYGDASGKPVIFFHSVRGSRLEVPGDNEVLLRLGIRLIIPDRPGYGRSDPLEDRDLDTLSADIACLADHLQLERFSLLGFSLGGFLALHCAARLAPRVDKLGLISSLGPPQLARPGRPLKGLFRLAVALADHAPALAEKILDQMAAGMLRDPRRHLGSPVDKRVLSEPETRDTYLRALRESCRNGSGGFVEDLKAVARCPDLHPEQLPMPVYLWHGEQDGQVAAEQAVRLDQWLTNSELTLLPDGGHFFVYQQWQDILRRFLA